MATYDTIEYLTTTKIGEKVELAFPKQFRDDLGLGNGASFVVLRLGTASSSYPNNSGSTIFAGK
jgi:hypothetical protein